jgi:hypothetical protein
MKTIIFVSIVTSLLILVGCKVLNKPSVPIDYYTKVQAASPIESKYTKLGGYSVKSKSYYSQTERLLQIVKFGTLLN